MRIDEAIVRWAKVGIYGIEFTSIRLAQRERIRALVMKDRSYHSMGPSAAAEL